MKKKDASTQGACRKSPTYEAHFGRFILEVLLESPLFLHNVWHNVCCIGTVKCIDQEQHTYVGIVPIQRTTLIEIKAAIVDVQKKSENDENTEKLS